MAGVPMMAGVPNIQYLDPAPGHAGSMGPRSARVVPPGYHEDQGAQPLDMGSSMGSIAPLGNGVVCRRKLYDQNLSDWSAKYRKERKNLDALAKDCELLRAEVAKHQQEVDERADAFSKLEERSVNEVMVKYNETKANFEAAAQQKSMLQVQLSENRKAKTQLTRERKLLTADFERKHNELLRTAEVRDQLDAQLGQLTAQLAQLSGDRRRMERELDLVQNNLRANTELADEVHMGIEGVFDGMKEMTHLQVRSENSINLGGYGGNRLDSSLNKSGGYPVKGGR